MDGFPVGMLREDWCNLSRFVERVLVCDVFRGQNRESAFWCYVGYAIEPHTRLNSFGGRIEDLDNDIAGFNLCSRNGENRLRPWQRDL